MEKPRAFIHHESGDHIMGNLVIGRFVLPLLIPATLGLVLVILSMFIGCSMDTFGGQRPNGMYLFLGTAAIYLGIWAIIGLFAGIRVGWDMLKEANDRSNR